VFEEGERIFDRRQIVVKDGWHARLEDTPPLGVSHEGMKKGKV
jgi:hypothetical protein